MLIELLLLGFSCSLLARVSLGAKLPLGAKLAPIRLA
jgi:hypothetical protein